MRLPYGRPNKNLLRELRQLAADADGVVASLAEINVLPEAFPREVLEDICSSLAGLQHGTAENCRPTLEYARNKIPEIRREHFFLEDDEPEDSKFDPDQPRLYRGMLLDRHLNVLLASISTALDEYRVQAQERFDDEVRGEEIVALQHPGETERPAASATDAIFASERARAELQEKGIDKTEKGDILARRLQDSRNLAIAARSQIRARKIVRRWFEGISTALRNVPELIGKAGEAVKVGTDIADSLAEWWSNTEHKLIKAAIDQVREFGDTLQEIGEKLKRRPLLQSARKRALDTPRDPAIVRAEAEVERMLKAGIEVPEDLARIVEEIDLRGSPDVPNRIKRWQDITRLRALRELRLTDTDFSLATHGRYLAWKSPTLVLLSVYAGKEVDLSQLGNISNLKSLWLQANSAVDLTPLGTLTALNSLWLRANSAEDLTPLSRLTALNLLSLHARSVTNLTPLGELTALNALRLQTNKVADLKPLGKLTALHSLSLHAGNVMDLTPLGNLAALSTLRLQASRAKDLEPLSGLLTLNSLSLVVRRAVDLRPLGLLIALNSLSMHANGAVDLTPLAELPNLTSLSLHANRVVDLTPLGQLNNLTSLSLHATGATDLTPVGQLTELTSLSLQANPIVDLAPLVKLTALKSLLIQSPRDIDLSLFRSLRNLRKLRINCRRLINETALKDVEIVFNRIP